MMTTTVARALVPRVVPRVLHHARRLRPHCGDHLGELSILVQFLHVVITTNVQGVEKNLQVGQGI